MELDFIEGRESLPAKTSNRIFYEAQVEVIRKQVGDLEKIRLDLGLSQRKISQLLLVDPSAWTRWTKNGESAPPHIYRALQWYMTIKEKIPGLTPQYFIGRDSVRVDSSQKQALLMLEQKIGALQAENRELRTAISHNRIGFVMMALGGIIFAVAFYWRYLR